MPIYDFSCPANHTFEQYLDSWRDENPKCGTCPEPTPTERIWASSTKHVGATAFPYVTSNITGQPVTVTSAAHLRTLCKMHGKTLRDDPGYVNEELRTTLEADNRGILKWKHRYAEGGVGAYESGRKWF